MEGYAALKCRSCKNGSYAPPMHMIKLTATQEITPYKWVHPVRSGEAARGVKSRFFTGHRNQIGLRKFVIWG
jgi:hypothetical protein